MLVSQCDTRVTLAPTRGFIRDSSQHDTRVMLAPTRSFTQQLRAALAPASPPRHLIRHMQPVQRIRLPQPAPSVLPQPHRPGDQPSSLQRRQRPKHRTHRHRRHLRQGLDMRPRLILIIREIRQRQQHQLVRLIRHIQLKSPVHRPDRHLTAPQHQVTNPHHPAHQDHPAGPGRGTPRPHRTTPQQDRTPTPQPQPTTESATDPTATESPPASLRRRTNPGRSASRRPGSKRPPVSGSAMHQVLDCAWDASS